MKVLGIGEDTEEMEINLEEILEGSANTFNFDNIDEEMKHSYLDEIMNILPAG